MSDRDMVVPGLEVLRESGFAPLQGKRVGLMTNPSAVDRRLESAYRIFAAEKRVRLGAFLAPEHGFAGAAPDGEHIFSTRDPLTGLPVYSLYGATRRPTPEMLAGLDAVVCDIQDVGARYYTFAWTVSHILEAAGEAGVEVVVLDRPNPLGGEAVAGPTLEHALASFVGRAPIPVVHGLTLGELARMYNDHWNPTPAELTVVPCRGWRRAMTWQETGLTWVPPSPNMPHLSTVRQYPGACLIEGTTLSEGRGTALPFEVVGAPWLDGQALADHLNGLGLEGVRFRPHAFRPALSKWAGQNCAGVQVHLTGEGCPITVWLTVIAAVRELHPDRFQWLPPERTGDAPSLQHFDRLIGNRQVREQIEAGVPVEEITRGWEESCRQFRQAREPYLIYS
ncbi:MAG: exo-beta-N-acetylmuramidase NamZ domain-containing protein [Anaerolineae bacterium]|jgi:uncharacterized protein YbbC (DUF1343 family)